MDPVNTPWLCRWWGHDLDPIGSHYYCVDYCTRCEKTVERTTGVARLRELASVRIWLIRCAIRDRFHYWRCWLKCSECGKRFGRHDDSFDHIPF